MPVSDNTKELQDQLKWVKMEEENSTSTDRFLFRRITKILVPLGCAATVGVLTTGLYYLIRRNSKKQQILMRYRVLAQGITLFIAVFEIFTFKM